MKTAQDTSANANTAAKPSKAKGGNRRSGKPAKAPARRTAPSSPQAGDAVHPVVHIPPTAKRGPGKEITLEFPGIGTVTLTADQIVKAGVHWKQYARTAKQWEKHLKDDDNDRMRGFKVPKAPTFTEAVRFIGEQLKGELYPVKSTGPHKGKKPGGPDQSWRICRAAAIQWRRENGQFFKKEIDPVHRRIIEIMRKTLVQHVREERILDGQVKVRTYKNTVGVSANKTDKKTLAVDDK